MMMNNFVQEVFSILLSRERGDLFITNIVDTRFITQNLEKVAVNYVLHIHLPEERPRNCKEALTVGMATP